MNNRIAEKKTDWYKGFITLEVVIALTILTLMLSATTLISFSNLSVLSDGKTDREVRGIIDELLAKARASLAYDFKQSVSIAEGSNGIYTTNLDVKTVDYFIKKLTATVSWTSGFGRTLQISQTEIVTDYLNTTGGDSCDGEVIGDWASPLVVNNITDLATLIGSSTGTYPVTDIDVYRDRLYVTTNNSSRNQETFFIFDVTDLAHPSLISKLDNDLVNNTGIKALFVYGDKYETYAYVANSSSFTKGQLQIIKVSDSVPSVISTYKIPTSIVAGSSNQGNGNSIFYKEGYVYLGLTKTVAGPEFNIIDVHDPFTPIWIGGYAVGNGVNDLFIKDGFAYLVTANDQELITLDVSNPANPVRVGGFDAPDSVGTGKSLYVVGDTIYLGRTATASHPELYLLDNSNPNTIPAPLGTREIGSSVNGIIARGDLLLLTTTSGQVQILDIASTSSITNKTPPLILPNSGSGVGLDCERNEIFVASTPNSGIFAGKGAISILTAK